MKCSRCNSNGKLQSSGDETGIYSRRIMPMSWLLVAQGDWPPPTEQHNVVTASQNVASLHAVQLCYSVGSSLCNVVNGTRKAVHGNVVQRCGICSTLPNVIQRCAMLSHRCQTLSNVVTKLCVVVSKLCNVSSCTTLPLSNAVQRCYNVAERYTTLCNVVATLPNVIQRCATL